MERDHPEHVVSRMQKALRKGKVLIDWSQNDEHKTTVNVYSLRAKPQPTVSTPVNWQEVESTAKEGGAPLEFTSGAPTGGETRRLIRALADAETAPAKSTVHRMTAAI